MGAVLYPKASTSQLPSLKKCIQADEAWSFIGEFYDLARKTEADWETEKGSFTGADFLCKTKINAVSYSLTEERKTLLGNFQLVHIPQKV